MSRDPILRIGWASANITPDRTAVIGGMPWARLSSGILDPLKATALVLESCPAGQAPQTVIFVGCDLRSMLDPLRDAVRANLAETMPEIDPLCVILNATHTHNAPPLGTFGIELEGMSEDEYVAFAAPRIAGTIAEAWSNRAPGGIGYGLGQAVVGRNRRRETMQPRHSRPFIHARPVGLAIAITAATAGAEPMTTTQQPWRQRATDYAGIMSQLKVKTATADSGAGVPYRLWLTTGDMPGTPWRKLDVTHWNRTSRYHAGTARAHGRGISQV